MALSTSAMLRQQTVLQQLLEEINFQRAKEMRQMLKDDGGFVMLQGTTYWTDLFVRHFLFQAETEQSIDSDDLLFFVRKKHVKGSSRHMPKFETDVDVYRKDSRKLPIGDPDVDWEETVYLNLIIHQFNYTLTLAICTRTSPKELQVLRRHSQRVYASPSRRKMDTKGDGEEMTYPHICFMVDNFDEVFCDILVRDGEMVCVELVANDRDGTVQGVIFLGSIRYDALKKVYDARQSSISTKLAQRMTFGLFSGGGPQTRCEFVRMKGPQGKGHAEMAVTKPKGSGVETPTSEPGFCMTDMYDEWDEDPDDFLNYRHQRRLSDPSANLNNYSRYGWKTKPTPAHDQSSKAMSQNEGLDSLASEVSEIEAGDLKDDGHLSASLHKTNRVRSASVVTVTTPTKTTTCCNCFGPLKSNQWDDVISNQMSDVYCRICDEDNDEHEYVPIPKDRLDSPAILTNVTYKRSQPSQSSSSNNHIKNVPLNIENRKKITNKSNAKVIHSSTPEITENHTNNTEDYELGDDVMVTNTTKIKTNSLKCLPNDMIRVRGKEELPVISKEQLCHNIVNTIDCESSHDATTTSTDNKCSNQLDSIESKMESLIKSTSVASKQISNKIICTNNHPLIPTTNCKSDDRKSSNLKSAIDDCNGNTSSMTTSMHTHLNSRNKRSILRGMQGIYSTMPRMKKTIAQHDTANRTQLSIPTRTTNDGTTIYYICDISKNHTKELDDGACNPLWTSKGFTQTFHFWKEHRRQQSVPLNAFLTYITLPWWSIAKDILDHRESPILTF